MKKFALSAWMILILNSLVYAQGKEVTIPGSQTRTIVSSVVNGQKYELQVFLPGSYRQGNKKYKVVYLLDSQWDFPLAKSLYGQQYYDGFIPELIIVGITWGGSRPNPDSLRARDYTPTHEKSFPQSGGAGNFLSFMKNELFPFVESNYRAEKDGRTLMGCSFGGLFTLYALFSEPGLFTNYIAASPAFEWDNGVIYQHEKKFFAQKSTAKGRLYMVMGGVERNVSGFNKLVKHLRDRGYTSLKIETRVLDNTGHSGTKAEGYSRGLQYAFQRNEITPSPALLNQYAGTYTIPNGNTIELKVENGKLVIYPTPNDRFELQAESNTSFYSVAEFLQIHFTTSGGVINGLKLDRFNSSQRAAKSK